MNIVCDKALLSLSLIHIFPRRADGKTMTAACSAAIDCGLHTFLLFCPL